MKKVIVLAIVAMMVMVFAASANAYLIKVQSCAPDGTCGSFTGQLGGGETASFTPLAAAVSAEATYAVFQGNVVDATQGHTLKLATAPSAWYGKVLERGGYNSETKGGFDLRIFSTTTTTKLATGTWYLYKGIAQVALVEGVLKVTNPTEVELLDSATLSTSQSTWAGSTFGAILEDGDHWTLSKAELPPVPEPGSMLAMLSGIVGLVGFGIRRRK